EGLIGTVSSSQSLTVLADARDRTERALRGDPNNQRHRATLAQIRLEEGEAYEDLRDWPHALDMFRQAAASAEQLQQAQPDDVGSRMTVLHAHSAEGMAYVRSGAVDRGLTILEQAIADAQRLLRMMPGNAYVTNQLASLEAQRGGILIARHRDREGCQNVRDGLARWNRLVRAGTMPGDSA